MIICVYVFNYVITLASLVCVAEKETTRPLFILAATS